MIATSSAFAADFGELLGDILSLPAHAAEGFEPVDDLRQAFLPRALAGEARGEVGFAERDGRRGEDAGDSGELLGQGAVSYTHLQLIRMARCGGVS